MKIYLAAKFEKGHEMRPIRDRLWVLGHEVVSTWIDEVARPQNMTHEEFFLRLADKDLCEIESADLFILDTLLPSERGGKEVEYGYALGRFHRKISWIVGQQRNVFHYKAHRVFPDWETCIKFIESNYPGDERAPQDKNPPQ